MKELLWREHVDGGVLPPCSFVRSFWSCSRRCFTRSPSRATSDDPGDARELPKKIVRDRSICTRAGIVCAEGWRTVDCQSNIARDDPLVVDDTASGGAVDCPLRSDHIRRTACFGSENETLRVSDTFPDAVPLDEAPSSDRLTASKPGCSFGSENDTLRASGSAFLVVPAASSWDPTTSKRTRLAPREHDEVPSTMTHTDGEILT